MPAMASDWTHARSFKLWSPASHTSFNSPRSHDSQGSTNPILGRFTTSSGRRPSRASTNNRLGEVGNFWASGEASAAATSKAKIKEGGEDAKAEIEKLQKAYEELDKRSKLILKLILVLSGLDIFLAL